MKQAGAMESRKDGKGPRNSVKSSITPSPASFRAKILSNCMNAIKSKRSAIMRKIRLDNSDNRDALMMDLVTEAYTATRKQDRAMNRTSTSDSGQLSDEADLLEDLGSHEHEELMRQIAEAIELELAMEQDAEFDEQFLLEDMEEENRAVEMYYEDLNGMDGQNTTSSGDIVSIICPICRKSTMAVVSGLATASCPCGAAINMVDRDSRQLISAADLKQRLADVYDRHLVHCELHFQQHQQQHEASRSVEYSRFIDAPRKEPPGSQSSSSASSSSLSVLQLPSPTLSQQIECYSQPLSQQRCWQAVPVQFQIITADQLHAFCTECDFHEVVV